MPTLDPARTPRGASAYLAAARPATLGASLAPVLAGSAAAAVDGRLRIDVALAAATGALLIQVGTNFVNDVADGRRGVDGPERLGPPRAVANGWITARAMWLAAAVAFIGAAVAGIYLVAVAGWPILIVGAVSIAAGVAYTAGPAPLAYLGLGEPFVFVFFGLVATAGTYYAHAGEVSGVALIQGAALGALATAILVVNNLRDRHGDAAAGKKTLAVRLGERATRLEYIVLVALAYAGALALAVGWSWRWVGPLASLPLAWRAVQLVRRADGRALNPALGSTARLELLFAALLAAGALA